MKFKMNSYLDGGENNRANGVKCRIKGPKGDVETLDADICLLSIGRRPYTKGL